MSNTYIHKFHTTHFTIWGQQQMQSNACKWVLDKGCYFYLLFAYSFLIQCIEFLNMNGAFYFREEKQMERGLILADVYLKPRLRYPLIKMNSCRIHISILDKKHSCLSSGTSERDICGHCLKRRKTTSSRQIDPSQKFRSLWACRSTRPMLPTSPTLLQTIRTPTWRTGRHGCSLM